MKKRTKIILISVIGTVITLPVVIYLLLIWAFPGTLAASRFRNTIPTEVVAFGESGHPAIAALGRILKNHPQLLTGGEYDHGPYQKYRLWLLPAPDQSVRLYGNAYIVAKEEGGVPYFWRLSIDDMEPFFAAGLRYSYWHFSHKPAFAIKWHPSIRSAFNSASGYIEETAFAENGPAADFAAALAYAAESIIETSPGRYRLSMENAAFEWCEESNEIVFELSAKPFKSSGMKLNNVEGWDYDKKAGTLAKRFAL